MSAHGLSQSEMGRKAGVPQPQVFRFLSGRTKTVTDQVRKLCTYANISLDSGIDTMKDNAAVAQAVSSVWDGSEESAALLADLIRALRPVLAAARQASRRGRRSK